MNMVMKPARFAILVLIFGLKVDAHAEEWGCYDPKPGHPTVEEKVLFAEQASVEAIAAERKYGVPAAALAAMSVVESGYGFTRIALDANNLFGFKSNSVTGPNGKPAYVLACQPAWDENNKYISFAARGDAFDYVASRLLKSKYYSKATERYQSEINSGREKSEATHDWIAAIASSYNHAPDKYVLKIENVIARYFQHLIGRSDGAQVAFSEQESPSSLAKIARASAGQYLNSIQKNGHTVIYNARGMHENCKNPDLSWGSKHPGFESYSGFPVVQCEYYRTHEKDDAVRRPAVKLLAVVWLLDADAEKISTWIGDACAVLRPREPAKCGIAIARMLLKQNGAQFPVAGHVLETQREAGCEDCEQDLLIYLPFRDGVTVTMKSDMQSRRNTTYIDGAAALEGAETTLGPLRSVQRYGRIANLDGKSIGSLDENWLFANRKAYLDALRSDSYSFLRVSAAAYCKENPVRCGISSPQ